jgi:hypothetical protein
LRLNDGVETRSDLGTRVGRGKKKKSSDDDGYGKSASTVSIIAVTMDFTYTARACRRNSASSALSSID